MPPFSSSRIRALAVVAALLGTSLTLRPTLAVSPPAPTSFTFGSAGDFTASADAAATLATLAGSATDVFVATGDLSYNTAPESAWCDFVKSKVGSTYPFEIVSGNHEDNGPNGTVGNFTACLPDRIGNVSGNYGREYFFDYPPSAPLARFIMISPDLTFADGTVEYTNGGVHTAWLANAIDEARAQGVRWVIVGMHKPCLSAGSKACTIGTDLQNLLVGKKVDLILQGHDHTYQRSKQLALSDACPALAAGSFNAACVTDDGVDNAYTKGAGPVTVIAGTGGNSLYPVSTTDPEAPYFAQLMGSNSNPTKGFVRYEVSADRISARFVRSAGGSLSDSFTISSSGNSVGNPPTATPVSATTAADTPVGVTLSGTDVETCELAFTIVAAPTHGSLSPADNGPCTATAPNRDSAVVTYTPTPGYAGPDAFTYQVNDGTSSSNTATATLTVNPGAGGGGSGGGITFRGASAGRNTKANTLLLPAPPNVRDGDVMVAAVAVRGTTTIAPPAGWTFVRIDNAANYVTQAVYVRTATIGDASSYTWKFSGAVPAAGGIMAYTGVDTTAPVDAHGGRTTVGSVKSITAPSVTTTAAGDVIIGLFGIGGTNFITPPSRMVERGEAAVTAGSNHVTWEGADSVQVTPGPTGLRTATASTAHPNLGQIIALRPA
ncbi:MAG: hypothetical protein QOI86_2994 [Actinomycetota bacterium]|nr:hypothetical protein [Actinomycetota bacterium]